MKKMFLLLWSLVLLLASCDTAIVDVPSVDKKIALKMTDTLVRVIDSQVKVVDTITFDNGVKVKWFKHGSGEKLNYGDCAMIDYKVAIKGNKIVDGNHLLNKASVPFLLGFNMQTPGWETALKTLKVGDVAEVFIPAKMARGTKGIKGLIPPNSDNILRIQILENRKPTREVDGNKVWVFEENDRHNLAFNDSTNIEFHCMVSTPSNSMYINTFRSNNPFKLSLKDGGAVPGLKKALINAKKSDRMFVYVPSLEAYGDKGYQDVVMANEDLFYNILVMDVVKE